MQGIYQRGKIFWFRFSHAGEQHRVSLETQDEAAAIATARKIAVAPEKTLGLARVGSWQSAVDAYLQDKSERGVSEWTITNIASKLKTAHRIIGREMLSQISKSDIERFKQARVLEVSAPTAREGWDQLNWFLTWCAEAGKIKRNPCADVIPLLEAQSVRTRFLSKLEIRTILETPCSNEMGFILRCGIMAGMRKDEVIQARPEWFDFGAGLLHLQGCEPFTHGGIKHAAWAPKGGKNRTIPLSRAFLDFLKGFKFEGQDFCIAPGIQQGKALYRFDFRRAYMSHLAACGLDDVTFHDLRRTFASQLVSAGVSIFKVAKWCGHSVKVAEKHYGHLIPNDDEINAAWG